MNIKEYISSGILEACVLGELPEQERALLEKNLVQYPELRDELNRIEEAQEQLLLATAIQPRKEVKQKLVDKIENLNHVGREVAWASGWRLGFWKLAAAASVSIALISSYLAYNYRTRWKATEHNLSELIAQNQRIAQDYNQVNDRLNKMETDLKVMDDPTFKRVIMKGTPNAPQAQA